MRGLSRGLDCLGIIKSTGCSSDLSTFPLLDDQKLNAVDHDNTRLSVRSRGM
jgi:hypothetical protein